MDDKIFFSALLYLLIAVIGAGVLPSEFYTGGTTTADEASEIRNTFDRENLDADSTVGQINFFKKIIVFMFFTWGVDDFPFIIATIIFMINIFAMLISAVWVYDKARGIGS